MTYLTTENILRIQKYLFENSFIQEQPTGNWTPHSLSGYYSYLESKGVPAQLCNQQPEFFEALSVELQEYLTLDTKVTFKDEEESELDEEDDENTESDESNIDD